MKCLHFYKVFVCIVLLATFVFSSCSHPSAISNRVVVCKGEIQTVFHYSKDVFGFSFDILVDF